MLSIVTFIAVSVFVFDCRLSFHQIENVDACLSFLDARGVNVQGLSAEGKTNKKYAIQGLIKHLIEWISGAAEEGLPGCISNAWKIHSVPAPPIFLWVAFHFFIALNIFRKTSENLFLRHTVLLCFTAMEFTTLVSWDGAQFLHLWQHRRSLGHQRGLWEDKASRDGIRFFTVRVFST